MSRKILLIGRTGQVGRELSAMLPQLGHCEAPGREDLDLAQPQQIRETIRAVSPQIIVNAAAYTAVDKAEADQTAARSINQDAPRVLGEEAARLGALLVHYSTDYVFDGTKGAPYSEADEPNPQSVYGRTKLGGEQGIRESGADYLIFRTAWVYAREGRNFLLTVLRLASEREELRIVSDQIGAPTCSGEIASATVKVLSEVCGESSSRESWHGWSGVYHLTAAGETSWWGFANAILREAAGQPPSPPEWFSAATRGRPLIARHVVPIATAEYPTPARRPAYSVLSNEKVASQFGLRLPDWDSQLQRLFRG